MSSVSVLKGAEPWGAEGDQTGALVVHGFTGSPQSVRPWAEAIAAEGRSVLVPRLPGHGTSVGDMQRTTSDDWVHEAEMSLRGLQERCHTVFVCGLSMGGTIALDLAARFGDAIAGVVIVNSPVLKVDPREALAPLLGRLPLALKGVSNDIADPAAKELAYTKVPTRAAYSFLKWRETVRARLADVKSPLLVFKSRDDHVVPAQNGQYVLDNVGSADKELVWLEKSYHVATLDYDRELIFDKTNEFIRAHTS
jgi:carboxylesterase